MAGRGAAPKPADQRHNPRDKPTHEWKRAGGRGWRHGKTPKAPDGLTSAARTAWRVWFGAWWAWFWEPEDIPQIRHMVRLYDQVERGEFQRHPELRLMLDTYGVTPKGRQDRRWQPPEEEPAEVVGEKVVEDRRRRLKVV